MSPELATPHAVALAPAAREAAPIVGRLTVTAPGASRVTVLDAYFDHVAEVDGAALDMTLPPGSYLVRAVWLPGHREVERLLALRADTTRELFLEDTPALREVPTPSPYGPLPTGEEG